MSFPSSNDEKADHPESLKKLRLQVVDDVEIVRRQLCEILRSVPDFEVVAEDADAISAISDAERLTPDVTVLDISLPDMTGIDAVRRILQVAPSTKILICSQHDLRGMVKVGLEAGAHGYLLKSDAHDELITAVRTIAKGEQYISAKLDSGAVSESSSNQEGSKPRYRSWP